MMKRCKHYDAENGWCKIKGNWEEAMPWIHQCDGNDEKCEEKEYDTVFDKFKQMDINKLAEWLDKYGAFDDSPWMNWWNKQYCDNCEEIKVESMTGYLDEFAYCELNHHCRFFPNKDEVPDNEEIIKMWLESEENE